jgi:hypothetical protein
MTRRTAFDITEVLYAHVAREFLSAAAVAAYATFSPAKGSGFGQIPEGGATHDILLKPSTDSYANSKKADALVVSCGRLQTLDLIVPVENVIKVLSFPQRRTDSGTESNCSAPMPEFRVSAW